MFDLIIEFMLETLPEYFAGTVLGSFIKIIRTKVKIKVIRVVLYSLLILIGIAVGIGVALGVGALIVWLLDLIGLI